MSNEERSPSEEDSNFYKWLESTAFSKKNFLWLLCIIGLTWLFLGIIVPYSFYCSESDKRGQFGDMFGGVTALFTAFSGMLTLLTVMIMRRQLKDQKRQNDQQGKDAEGRHNAIENMQRESQRIERTNLLVNLTSKRGSTEIIAAFETSKTLLAYSDTERNSANLIGVDLYDKISGNKQEDNSKSLKKALIDWLKNGSVRDLGTFSFNMCSAYQSGMYPQVKYDALELSSKMPGSLFRIICLFYTVVKIIKSDSASLSDYDFVETDWSLIRDHIIGLYDESVKGLRKIDYSYIQKCISEIDEYCTEKKRQVHSMGL